MGSITDSLNLSILELISILIPGAIVVVFFQYFGIISFFGLVVVVDEGDLANGLFFFFAAYFLGYVFYVASSFLDGCYDRIKRRALGMDTPENLQRHAEGLSPILKNPKKTIYGFFLRNLDDTHMLVSEIVEFKNRDIGIKFDGYHHQVINAYQYAFRRLMFENPAMFAEVERYFATARFFRSMFLVFGLGSIMSIFFKGEWMIAILLLSLAFISLFVFLNRWRKASHVAFKDVIILEGRASMVNSTSESKQ